MCTFQHANVGQLLDGFHTKKCSKSNSIHNVGPDYLCLKAFLD